jgi:hypothetical protein
MSLNLMYIQDVPNTISFDDLQRMGNQDDLSSMITETHSRTHSPREEDNYHPLDSQMHDGTEDGIEGEKDRVDEGEEDGIDEGGEDGIDEGEDEGEDDGIDERGGEEDLTGEYFPGRIRSERGRGRRGRGAGIGGGLGGLGGVQNHNWRPDCNRGSGKLNLISGNVARAHVNASVSDDDNDEEFNPELEDAQPEGGQGAFAGNTYPSVNESQALSEQARSVLLKLSKSCQAILNETGSSKYYTDASQILEMLVGESPTWNANSAFADNSMEAIVSRCQRAERLVSCAKFIHALALIHFRTKVER